MDRVPEISLMSNMDSIYEYHKVHKSQTNGYLYYFKKYCGAQQGTVVDLGCGTSDYLIALKKRSPKLSITGYDGSESMIEFSKQNIKENQCTINVCCQLIEDVDTTADIVTSSYTLHHFRDPGQFWGAIEKTAEQVFVLDLLRPDTIEDTERIVKDTHGDQDLLFQQDYYNSLRAAFTKDEIRKQIKPLGLDFSVIGSPSGLYFIIVYGFIKKRI